ncbi:hypothetical protein AGMMS49965_08230 [Bacteroidia bacterium]|nr:hypothetical protein AGMMS49965_08230 [Bacteroidia bacterium]
MGLIKFSKGICRDKNDKIDSRDIALYAARFQDRMRAYQLYDENLKSLELLHKRGGRRDEKSDLCQRKVE